MQAAHAACELVYRFGGLTDPRRWGKHGPHLVWLGVRDEVELASWATFLAGRCVAYREPDRGHELTALAYWGPRIPEFEELRLV